MLVVENYWRISIAEPRAEIHTTITKTEYETMFEIKKMSFHKSNLAICQFLLKFKVELEGIDTLLNVPKTKHCHI